MNKSDNSKSVTIHRRVKSATSIDRSQVKRPVSKKPAAQSSAKSSDSSVTVNIKKSAPAPARSKMISHFNSKVSSDSSIGVKIIRTAPKEKLAKVTPKTIDVKTTEQVVMHPILKATRARIKERQMMMVAPQPQSQSQSQSAMNARELKEIAIKKALASTARATEKEEVKPHKLHFSLGRILIAFGCTAAAIFAIAYFINLNVSDFSLYAAAIEAGIESDGREPRVPQEFTISNISSENGKVTSNYHNATTDKNMSISKEKSSWDSNALLTNFVRDAYGDTYITVREQGLTIYVSDSEASWVNGGFVYKITAPSGSLTKKQIRQIATSF